MLNFILSSLLILFLIKIIHSKQRPTSFKAKKNNQQQKLHKGYLAGLNFLLNEESDKAVDIFIQMLEVDADTVETHLALGHLFRKRGEVDRAIRIHQNLIARPNLATETKIEALIALGKDYLTAGVLDRAERVFMEIITLDPKNISGLRYLRDIYQQEKEWDKAISVALRLPDGKKKSSRILTSHYYCEKACESFDKENYGQVKTYIKQALQIAPGCFRANLLQADVLIRMAKFKQAIKYLRNIIQAQPEFISEVIGRLEKCYVAIGGHDDLVKTLKLIVANSPCFSAFSLLSKYVTTKEDKQQLYDNMEKFLLLSPSIDSLSQYLQLFSSVNNDSTRQITQRVLHELKARSPAYRCRQCGYAGNIFQWQCPSCKYWGKIKPILI